MADIIDDAGALIEMIEERRVAAIREAAASIPKGESGECVECGIESARLVYGQCAPCRDGRY